MEPVTVGRVRISRVVEWEGSTRPTWILPDAVPAAVARHRAALAPHFVDARDRFLMSIHAFVVEAPGLVLLVDTCVGNGKPRSHAPWHMLATTFLEDLAARGVPPEAVDLVLCTHLHVDHVGWNTRLADGRWVPTFPRARYLFARREWEFWAARDGDGFGPVIADSVRPVVEAGRADLVEGTHRISEELALVPTPGHTPGHVSLEIASGGARALITGDLLHHPVQCRELDWNSIACEDGTAARATRRTFLGAAADSGALVLGTHFARPTAGRVVADGSAFRFVPA